ncbi:MAG: murein hydrolase activator EnvC family protein [Bradymonadia bacterium]
MILTIVVSCPMGWSSRGIAEAQSPQQPLVDMRLKAMMAREDQLADAMEALDREIIDALQAGEALEKKASTAEAALVDVSDRLTALSARVTVKRARLKRRLRARHQVGQAGLLKVLLSAEGPTEIVRRQSHLERVVAHDLALMSSLSADERALAEAQRERQGRLDELAAVGEARQQHSQSLEAARRLKSRAVDRIRRERRLMRQLVRQQQRARAQLPRGLMNTPGQVVGDGMAAEAGRLLWPVVGEVSRGFGPQVDATLGTRTVSKGWEIVAAARAPVRAVYAGTVVYAGWYKGFGNLVMLDHGDRHHTLYAHLAVVNQAKGARVEQGDIIGHVGDTASLRGPMLYFEIRGHGEALDPAAWLRPIAGEP